MCMFNASPAERKELADEGKISKATLLIYSRELFDPMDSFMGHKAKTHPHETLDTAGVNVAACVCVRAQACADVVSKMVCTCSVQHLIWMHLCLVPQKAIHQMK